MKYPTVAMMQWDDKYLYIAYECWEDDIWATKTKDDDFIYVEQVMEVFIDPEGRGGATSRSISALEMSSSISWSSAPRSWAWQPFNQGTM